LNIKYYFIENFKRKFDKKNLKGITKRIRKQRARQVPKGSCHKKTFPAAWKKKRKFSATLNDFVFKYLKIVRGFP